MQKNVSSFHVPKKATFDRLVELQLSKEGYRHSGSQDELEGIAIESVVLPENLQQQLHRNHSQQKQQQHHQADEEIAMIDGAEKKEILEYCKGATPQAPENIHQQQQQQSLDSEILELQRDLRDITAKIEDYNFSQNELGRELGLGGGILRGMKRGGAGGGAVGGGAGGARGAGGDTKKKNDTSTRKEWKKSEEKKALKSSTTLPLLGEAAAGKSSTLPLLLPGLMTITSGGAGDESDDRYINYSRQITRDDGGYSRDDDDGDFSRSVQAYTRQSTMMTDDTLLTESNRQTTLEDDKAGKVHL